MCGFVGISDFDDGVDIERAKRALKSIEHRGPDAQQSWTDEKNIYLGHNRLSIIDLSNEANQPFTSSHADAIIVYNGEIYNYRELRAELSFRNFRTNSDTEVLLEGYLEKGVEFFNSLRGMYAFAILDRRAGNKIVLARDPAGIKPLYYLLDKKTLMFGSEIKALKKFLKRDMSINELAIKQFLNLGFIPEPHTAYKHIFSLRPGHTLVYRPNETAKLEPFFSYKFGSWNSFSFDENLEKISNHLRTAVNRNYVSDVDVSIALSGGIDSSLIYHYAKTEGQMLSAKTISFSDIPEYDEAEVSKLYSAQNSDKHEIISVRDSINIELIDKLFLHFDQPFADSSAIPVYFINKTISESGKVVIGGEGGDELFNGYPSQTLLTLFYPWSKYRRFWKSLAKFGRILPGSYNRKLVRISNMVKNSNNPFELLYHRNSWFPQFTIFDGKEVFNEQTDHHIRAYEQSFIDEVPDTFEGKVVFDYFRKIMLSDYLRKTDMMSMINGVEWRVPMLDEDLTRLAFSIPFHQKSDIRQTKKHLRALHKTAYSTYASSAPKSGFEFPLDSYLCSDDKKKMGNEILKNDSIVTEYVNKSYIQFLLKEFNEFNNPRIISRGSVYQRVLMLYILQRWFDTK